jgi:hypothetical protein
MADHTVVPVENTSIMRFVTIRGVNSLTTTQAGTQFLEYDAPASVADRQSNAPQLFYNIIVAIRENDALDAAAQAAAMQTAIANFKQTSRYIANESDLETAADAKRIALGAFLRQERHRLQKDEDDSVANFQLTPLSATAHETLKLQIWDNFLLQVLEQKNTELADQCVAVLRALHFEKLQNTADWWDLTHAMPVLPDTIFPLKKDEITVSIVGKKTETSEKSLEISEIQKELDFLKAAKQEIALWESNTNEMLVFEQENQVIAIQNDNIDSEELKSVTEKAEKATQEPAKAKITTARIYDAAEIGDKAVALFEMLRLPKNPRTELVRNRIAQREEELNGLLFQKIPLQNEVVVYAGAVWQRTSDVGIPTPVPIVTPTQPNSRSCFVRPLGVADFMRVEQKLCRYVPGEVSHIENVLRGEMKSRTTRNLFRSENTYSYSKETEKEDERDTQTTDRFETEKETSRMINEQISASADVNVMGTYGVTTVNANAGASYDRAQEDSNRDSVRSSKEVVEHVRQRMTERIKEERITKILKEYEETNVHGFKNDFDTNTVGVYRWLDKVYLATLKNYGKRLTFAFDIPEPAAFHLWAMTDADNPASTMVLTEPVKPDLANFASIDESNYKNWAAAYGAYVDLPPAEQVTTFNRFIEEGTGIRDKVGEINHIANYYVERFVIDAEVQEHGKFWLMIGSVAFQLYDDVTENRAIPVSGNALNIPCNREGVKIPVSAFYYGNTGHDFVLHITTVFKRSEQLLNTWKQKTFNTIMSAYETKLAEYRNALEEAKALARNERRAATNPAMNEQIVRAELKKMCMYSFVKDAFFVDNPQSQWDYASVSQMSFWNTWDGRDGFPEYNLACDAQSKFRRERMYFMEEAFDWDLLVAEFLPYYYAQQPKWKKLYQLTDNDPMFLNFLQAGMARVRVPVKVGKEVAALRFWQTGAQQIQRGNEPYLTSDPFIKALIADINKPITEIRVPDLRDNLNSWYVRIPTTLTMLEEASNGIGSIACNCPSTPEDILTMPCIESGKKH